MYRIRKKTGLIILASLFFVIFGFSTVNAAYEVLRTNSDGVGVGYSNWKAIASNSTGQYLAAAKEAGNIYTSSDYGVTWVQRPGAGSRYWTSIASDSTGQYLVAGTQSDYIYTSSDYGVTWTQRTNSTSQTYWFSVDSNSTGQYLFAVSGGSTGTTRYIYTSSDYGATWTARTAPGSRNWSSVASSSTGQYAVASARGGYIYTSSDYGATWTLRTGSGSRQWVSVDSNSTGQYLVAGVGGASGTRNILTSSDYGVTWVARTGAGSRAWNSVTSDSTGQYLAAAVISEFIYTSSDYGATWSYQTSTDYQGWSALTSNSTGQYIYAGATSDHMYRSSNYGSTWIIINDTGIKDWQDTVSNSTGQYLMASVWNDYIYTSSDYGVTWTQRTSAGKRYWSGITINSTGQYLAGVASTTGYIYTSSDYGVNWTERTGTGTQDWESITSDSTGQYLAAVVNGGYIYTSSNYGATWTQRTGSGLRAWKSIASNSTGQYLVAGVGTSPGYIYTSSDYGATWTEHTGPGFEQWYGSTVSSSGQYMAVVSLGGQLWTSSDYGATWVVRIGTTSNGWKSITSSSSGQYMAAVASNNYIHTSSDYGATWATETTLASEWESIFSNSTGQYLFATRNYDLLYVLESTTPPITTYTLSTTATNGSITKDPDLAEYDADSSVTLTAVPDSGYSFVNWTGDCSGTNSECILTMDANKSVTANFALSTYTISYNLNGATGGSVPSNQTKTHGVDLTLASNTGLLEKTGYTFAGWNTQADGNGTDYTQGANFTINANTTLYAKWSINQYTLTFDSGGGSAVSPITDDFGATVTPPADPTRTGYTFAGWNPALPATIPSSNETYTALWTINQYTLTFDTDGGTAVAPITDDYNTPVSTPTSPTKTGYTFTGWSPSIPSNIPASDETYTAQWSVNQYTLTFDSDGGSAVSPITDDFGATVTTPADPTKEGYTFGGWNPALPSTIPASNETYTALWNVDQFSITFDSNGGSTVDAITDDFGATVTPPADPTREGYTFTGWSPSLPSTMPASNNSHIAQWSVNQYTLTFDSNGGSAVSPITDDFGTTVTPPTSPTKTGYTFTGWSPALPGTIPSSNNTYTAQWSVNQYTLTFDADGGSTVDPIIDDYGATITSPTNPTKEGYTFTGWSPSLPSTMPASNNSYTAQWSVNEYTLTFDSNGGSAVASITDDFGTTVTPPTSPTKTGYTFAGWNPALPSTIPATNQTHTAVWTIGQFAITFNTDGGTVVNAIIDDFGATVTPPTSPTKSGYTFAGWSPTLPATMPASNTSYTALWTEIPPERSSSTTIQTRIVNLAQMGNLEQAQELSVQYNQPLPLIPLIENQTTIESLKTLLVQLQTQLQVLLSKNSPSSRPSSNISFTRDLEINSEGEDVRELQRLLISKGYSIPSGATGFFGQQTRQALIKFQQDNNISPAAGYYGSITRAKLTQ